MATMVIYYILIFMFTLFAFTSGENMTRWQSPTKSISIAFPGRSCDQQFIIEGAVLISSNDAHYTNDQCTLRFSPVDSHKYQIHRRLMLKFTWYNITDCRATLKVYYRHDSSGSPDVVLGCHSSHPPPFLSGSSYMTLQLSRRNATGYDFRIVITAFSENPSCDGFLCDNKKCIDKGLLCDGVRNCFDHSDTDETNCDASDNGKDLPIPWPLYLVFAILVISGSIGYSVFKIYCRNRLSLGNASRSQVIALQRAERSGLLVGNAATGNVVTLQQPIYLPDVQHQSQLPPQAFPNQPPYPQQPNYLVSQPQYIVQTETLVPGEGLQQPAVPPPYPDQQSFYPQQSNQPAAT